MIAAVKVDTGGNVTDSQKKSVRAGNEDHLDLERDEAAFRRAAKEMTADEFASPTPLWYRVIMFSLVGLGILWIIVFYLSGNMFPVPSIGSWNIVVGVALMMVGMVMMTRWR